MAWVRLDDHFDEHPKLARVGPLGWGIWVAGLAYCNRNLTDGFIPRARAVTLASFDVIDESGRVWHLARSSGMVGDNVDAAWVIDLLLDAGLWDEVYEGDRLTGYRIHDFHEYQPSKEQVLAERGSNARRQADFRERSKRNGPRNAVTNAVTDGVTGGESGHSSRNAPRNGVIRGVTNDGNFLPTHARTPDLPRNAVSNGPVTVAPVPVPVKAAENTAAAIPPARARETAAPAHEDGPPPSPPYRELLNGKYDGMRAAFVKLNPAIFTEEWFDDELAQAQFRIGPVSVQQLAKALRAAHAELQDSLRGETPEHPIRNKPGFARNAIRKRLQEQVR